MPVRRLEIVWLVLVFALALALRWIGLGWESVWLDEAFSLDMARYSLSAIWKGEPLDPGNPPGYYLLLHAWLLMIGERLPALEAGRAFSGLFGALTVLATWWFAKNSGASARVRLLAALFVAVSPPLVFLSREIRVYTLFGLMVTLAGATGEGLVRAVIDDKRAKAIGYWILFTLSAATLNYLHYYSILVLPVLGGYVFFRLALQGWVYGLSAVLSMGLVGAAFLPWVGLFLQQIKLGTTRGGGTWLMHLVVTPLYSLAGHTLVWKQDGMATVGLMTALAALVVYLPALRWLSKSGRWPAFPLVLAVGLTLMAILISVVKSPMLQSRYLSAMYPALMIVLAAGIAEGFQYWRRGARVVSWTVAGLMIASLTLLYTKLHKEDWRPIAGYVAREGNTQPAYCYEDVAKLSFNYYVPWVKTTSIDPVARHFSPGGKSWEESGLADEMRAHSGGFWFILYLSLGETQPELLEIDAWLRANFRVIGEHGNDLKQPTFPLLHLYHLAPK